jgi:hypothetical protein
MCAFSHIIIIHKTKQKIQFLGTYIFQLAISLKSLNLLFLQTLYFTLTDVGESCDNDTKKALKSVLIISEDRQTFRLFTFYHRPK